MIAPFALLFFIAAVEAPAPPPPAGISDRTRQERRLGLSLAAPSFVVMVLVTAYPLVYAVVLSLYNYRLTDPAGKEYVGLQNYATVLTDPLWWTDFTTTAMAWGTPAGSTPATVPGGTSSAPGPAPTRGLEGWRAARTR